MIHVVRPRQRVRAALMLLVAFLALPPPLAAAADEAAGDWREVIRQTPYWESQGVADNLATLRRWVLLGESYCGEPARHLLFDRRFRFLGYVADGIDAAATHRLLNQTRRRLAGEGRVESWTAGSAGTTGYPFALSCDQPFVAMEEAIARLTGSEEEYRLWGTWDGISVGAEDAQVPLIELFHEVYATRREQQRFTFPASVLPTFLGKVIIESGGRKDALSPRDARGIMQLSPAVLDDCRVPEQFRLHRIVQVDCALRLVEQNHRNLRPPFEATFGHLSQDKRERLYGLLLTQAYQIGVGRAIELLRDADLGAAARYFAGNAQRFSAEDILVGMLFHNLGRKDIGLRSLYYVTDARIAREHLCDMPTMQQNEWCVSERPQ